MGGKKGGGMVVSREGEKGRRSRLSRDHRGYKGKEPSKGLLKLENKMFHLQDRKK
jgi:hypothetical protein